MMSWLVCREVENVMKNLPAPQHEIRFAQACRVGREICWNPLSVDSLLQARRGRRSAAGFRHGARSCVGVHEADLRRIPISGIVNADLRGVGAERGSERPPGHTQAFTAWKKCDRSNGEDCRKNVELPHR